jgi:hypothetical protein
MAHFQCSPPYGSRVSCRLVDTYSLSTYPDALIEHTVTIAASWNL